MSSFYILVAGTGIEPVSRGYEPRELPLLYPAIFLLPILVQKEYHK